MQKYKNQRQYHRIIYKNQSLYYVYGLILPAGIAISGASILELQINLHSNCYLCFLFRRILNNFAALVISVFHVIMNGDQDPILKQVTQGEL